MSNIMGEELRALRLAQLNKVVPHFVSRVIKSNYPDKFGDATWILRFSEPENHQHAVIDSVSGKVLGVYQQVNNKWRTSKEPMLFLKTIDRRINSLWRKHKHSSKESENRRINITN